MTLLIGSHVSFVKEKQLLGCVEEAITYGANTFMFYTGAPQNTNRVPINDALTIDALELMKKNSIDYSNILVHAPYIINLANSINENNYSFAISFLKQEINRCEQLGVTKLILHPGSHVGEGVEIGIKNIINALNQALSPEQSVIICLETMSGKGSECGSNFDEIKKIIDGVNLKEKLKVCLDTCHLHDAGYDINNFDEVLDEFDNIIGFNNLACIHINDSKNINASKKDRHENFGMGNIGFESLINVIYNKRLLNIPKILETPYVSVDDDSTERVYPPYKFEIDMIKKKEKNDDLLTNIREYYKKTK